MHTLTFVVVLAVVGISRSSFLPWWHRLRVKTIVDKIVSVQTDSLKKHVMLFFFFSSLKSLKGGFGLQHGARTVAVGLGIDSTSLILCFHCDGNECCRSVQNLPLAFFWRSSMSHTNQTHNNVYNHSKQLCMDLKTRNMPEKKVLPQPV